VEPITISELVEMGSHNRQIEKIIDYETAVQEFYSEVHPGHDAALPLLKRFHSYDLMINNQYFSEVKKTEPIDRNTKRAGLIAYKMGMTHYWN
jgi:hypothetical protein